MENPLVSVIMITYGHEKYIQQAIESVFMQKTNFSIELIIANDESPDNTDNVIQEVLKNTPSHIIVRYTKHEKNMGMITNFNWALKQAKNKYNAICEGDDFWIDENKLQKQVDFLESNEKYLIHSGKAKILEDNEFLNTIGNPLSKNTYNIADFYTKNNLITCTVLFRNIEFHKTISPEIIFGDWMLYTQLLSSKKESLAYVSDDIVSVYRIHSGGIMQTLSKKIDSDIAHLKQIIAIRKITNGLYNLQDIKMINNYCLNIFHYNFINKNYMECLKTTMQNFKLINTKIKLRSYLGFIRYNYRNL